jgi:hypothetical protein
VTVSLVRGSAQAGEWDVADRLDRGHFAIQNQEKGFPIYPSHTSSRRLSGNPLDRKLKRCGPSYTSLLCYTSAPRETTYDRIGQVAP